MATYLANGTLRETVKESQQDYNTTDMYNVQVQKTTQ